jgi:hypothetical protein
MLPNEAMAVKKNPRMKRTRGRTSSTPSIFSKINWNHTPSCGCNKENDRRWGEPEP